MATAGRILIMPKGAWDSAVTYEMLDLVSHGGKAWLAKKTSVGIEPTFDEADYWHPILGADGSFITESDFEAFKNETNEILEKTYTIDNPPTAGEVGARSEDWMPTAEQVGAIPIVDCAGSNKNLDIVMKSGKHRGLYLTDSNTLGTPYKQGITSETSAFVFSFANSTTFGVQFALVGGEYNKLTFIRTMVNGVISDWTTGFLPLTGGTLSGELFIAGGYSRFTANGSVLQIESRNEINQVDNRRMLYLRNSKEHVLQNALALGDLVNGSQKIYNLFGEHNKPSGAYTGNNSSTARKITVGGLSKILFIHSNYSFGFVSPAGGMFYTGSGYKAFTSSQLNFSNNSYGGQGVLYIATTDAHVNRSSYTYSYDAL